MLPIQDSSTVHFASLLRSGAKYVIPKYQRDYSWDVEQWDDLWLDILDMLKNNGSHYMGYLVLQAEQNSKKYSVIDGQQRFTTISIIILAAVKSIMKLVAKGVQEQENQQRVRSLMDAYIGSVDPVSLEYDNILELNRNNNSYYKDYIVKLGELKVRNTSFSEKLMKKCFEWYGSKLDGMYATGKDYAEFVSNVVDNLYFTVIRVSDEMNAFRVFETLNARGVQLSSADLLKNYLFSLVDTPARVSVLEEKWNVLVRNIQSEKLPDFIRTYWNSRYKAVRSADLFKSLKDRIRTVSDVFAFVADMISCSDVYMALKNPDDELWHSSDSLSQNIELLNIFEMKQASALLVSGYSNLNKETFALLLKDVFVVCFRYCVICGNNSNDAERIFNKIAIEISEKGVYDKRLLKEVYVNDDEFVASFKYCSFVDNSRNVKVIKYILSKIETFRGGVKDVFLYGSDCTVEHILPQNPGEEWGEDNYEIDSLIYRLGNMCLLEKRYNKEVQNLGYSIKKEIYRLSSFVTTNSIPDRYLNWTASSVNARQASMADCAKSIWRVEI